MLDAASARMLETGVRHTSIEEVARGAGVGEQQVLGSFPTLADLVDAVLSREVQRMLAEVTAVSVTTMASMPRSNRYRCKSCGGSAPIRW